MSSDRAGDPTGDLTWRPLTRADIDAWVVLNRAIEAVEHTGEHVDAAQLAEHFGHPGWDFARGSAGAFDRAGALVAMCLLQTRTAAEPVHEVRLEGGVHPDRRGQGLGTRLLAWAEQAVPPLHEQSFPGSPLSLHGAVMRGNTGAEQLFAAHGYASVRWFNEMRLDLAQPRPEPGPAPAGVEFLPYREAFREDARLVRDEAFRDHWGSTVTTPERWAGVVEGSAFRPELTFLAYEDGEPLALVLCEEFEAHRLATGQRELYVALVGTRRIGRKRGLASALLGQVLRLGAEAGFDTASLGVDADSPTGALGLYERLGFRAGHVWVVQSKALIPAV
jgi:GNAT superfamily N-acetyltransferase